MIIEHTLTKDDLCAFNIHHTRRSPAARRQYLTAWFLPAAIGLAICLGLWYLANLPRGEPLKTLRALSPLFLGVPVYLVLFPFWYRLKVRGLVARMVSEGANRGLFGTHRVTLAPEGLSEVSGQGTTMTPWPVVERIVVSPDHAFIYINALAAVIVPRRAFANEADFDAFVATARRYQEQATSVPPLPA